MEFCEERIVKHFGPHKHAKAGLSHLNRPDSLPIDNGEMICEFDFWLIKSTIDFTTSSVDVGENRSKTTPFETLLYRKICSPKSLSKVIRILSEESATSSTRSSLWPAGTRSRILNKSIPRSRRCLIDLVGMFSSAINFEVLKLRREAISPDFIEYGRLVLPLV